MLVATAGDPGPGMGVLDEHLNELMLERGAPATVPEASAHAISRVALRRLLLDGLDVHFGKEFVRYERLDGGLVTAHFADGTTATGDVLVGADGSRSRVRGQLLPGFRTTAAPGIGIGGRLPLTERTQAWLPGPFMARKNLILPKRDFLFTAVYRQRDGGDGDYVMWAFVTHPRNHQGPVDKPHPFVQGRISGWHRDLRRLVEESDPATVQSFDFAAAARPKPWGPSNVTLLGDAIHFMPPVGGLGGNAALHDAQQLCEALTAADGDLVESIGRYEAEMLDSGFAAVRESVRYLWLAILPSRAVRALARGFFRLCGAVPPLRRAVFDDH